MDLNIRVVVSVLAALNLISFFMMGIDKAKAKAGKRRISEKRLFLSALLMGGIGGTAGMFFFRHKTRHWYFRLFFPLIAFAQAALLAYLYMRLH